MQLLSNKSAHVSSICVQVCLQNAYIQKKKQGHEQCITVIVLFLKTVLFNSVKIEVIFTPIKSISTCLTGNKSWKHSAHILGFKERAACVNSNKSGAVL